MKMQGRGVYKVTTINVRWLYLSIIQILSERTMIASMNEVDPSVAVPLMSTNPSTLVGWHKPNLEHYPIEIFVCEKEREREEERNKDIALI